MDTVTKFHTVARIAECLSAQICRSKENGEKYFEEDLIWKVYRTVRYLPQDQLSTAILRVSRLVAGRWLRTELDDLIAWNNRPFWERQETSIHFKSCYDADKGYTYPTRRSIEAEALKRNPPEYTVETGHEMFGSQVVFTDAEVAEYEKLLLGESTINTMSEDAFVPDEQDVVFPFG